MLFNASGPLTMDFWTWKGMFIFKLAGEGALQTFKTMPSCAIFRYPWKTTLTRRSPYTLHSTFKIFEMRSVWPWPWFTWIVGFMQVNAEMLWLTMPREDERGVLGHCRGEGCKIRCKGYTRWTAAEKHKTCHMKVGCQNDAIPWRLTWVIITNVGLRRWLVRCLEA